MRSIFLSLALLASLNFIRSARSKNKRYKLESWMSSLSPKIRDKKLSQISIPGTQNSGSYPIKIGSPMTDLYCYLSGLTDSNGEISPSMMNFVRAVGPGWTKTQDHSIEEQLRMGHRYLDLRVYCDEGKYFLHNFFIGSNFTNELLNIAEFVGQQQEEVVILHIKSVSNCDESSVRHLLQFIEKTFGEKLVKSPSKIDFIPSYAQLVDNGTTVIVAIPHAQLQDVEKFDWIWDDNRIVDPWANTASEEKLKTFVIDKMGEARQTGTLFVSQMVLTPTTDSFNAGLAGTGPTNLREMALKLNKAFRRWIGDFRQLETNIFISDFAKKSLIRKIIDMNFKKGRKRGRSKKVQKGENTFQG